ncbi:MAG: hypothetical protein R6U93_03420 [Dehalococcoidia bacterium]
MTTRRQEIKAVALEILKSNPAGVHYSELVRRIQEKCPHIPVNTIHGNVWNLEVRYPNEVYKPAKGVFRHVTFAESGLREDSTGKGLGKHGKAPEEAFYQPFADWLVSESEDCTKAVALGRNKFRDKWGTPDVIGKRESLPSDIIKAPTEIVSAEIKADARDLITAFGQACSYRLFSHKSYIVVPRNSSPDDILRIDALCMIFGIGLVLFESRTPSNPEFQIEVRPFRQEPDMFYVNKYLKLIERELFG